MNFAQFVSIIQESKIHFHRADDFRDPYEGSIPPAVRSACGDVYDDTDIESMRENVFLNCWHRSSRESAAMWDLYGESDKTVAISGFLGNLIDSIDDADEEIVIQRVSYQDYDGPDIDECRSLVIDAEGDISPYGFHLIKRMSFEHEKEIRMMLIDETKGSGKGVSVPADINSLLEKVYISPTADPWFERTVREFLREKVNDSEYELSMDIESDVIKSDLYDESSVVT